MYRTVPVVKLRTLRFEIFNKTVLRVYINRSRVFWQKLLQVFGDSFRVLITDPIFFWMRIFARFEFSRDWHTSRNSSIYKFVEPASSGCLVIDESISTICGRLEQDGYYQGFRLSSECLRSFLDFAYTHPCYADREHQSAFYVRQRKAFEAKLQRPIKLASYLDTHESSETFQALKHDPTLLGIAASYLRSEPKYHRSGMLWTFPGFSSNSEKMSAAQVIHCDINDYRTVKFFFYLTHVNIDCGPHQYLRGSHRNRNPIHQLLGQRCASIDDRKLIDIYGEDCVSTVCGPAGFGFVGDPYTFHNGTLPRKHPRLLLQLEFGLNCYKVWHFQS